MSSNAVVTPHTLSAAAGRRALERGGNAVDAAVAAVAAQGVVAPETCGLGGDLFALIHAPGWERPLCLNSSGRAGSNASAEAIRAGGNLSIPEDHPAAVTIPGCVDGMETLISELGTLTLSEVLAPAIELATDGFDVSTEQARAFNRQKSTYAPNPAVRDFYPNGEPVKRGDRVTRADLAATLEAIAQGGRNSFYGGVPGEDISSAVDGLITMRDMEPTLAQWVEPIGARAAALTGWTTPPNSQGYLGPATIAVFEMLDPPRDPENPLWWHLLIESYRCLAWERDDLVSDPEHLVLPSGLFLDSDRLERAANSVDADRAGVWPSRVGALSGTAYMCAADSTGMAVSLIQSNYRGTGSPFGAARSGFLLQDRGMGFTLTPGHPNELAPGKRPLHTLSPTIWTDDTGPRWVLGTRGGAVQPQLVAQLAARAIVGDQALADAQGAPRWTITDFGPNSSPAPRFEPATAQAVLDGLVERGHVVSTTPSAQPGWGPMSVIELKGDVRSAAADPRVDTTAAVVF